MTPNQARSLFVGKPARTCKCGHSVFHVPPAGGLVCSRCVGGESILTLTAIPGERKGKFVWQEFDPDWDTLEPASENSTPPPTAATYWEDDPHYPDVAVSRVVQADPGFIDQSTLPENDGRRCRMRSDVIPIGGVLAREGDEYTIQYRFRDRLGREWCNLLRPDGQVAIAHCAMEKVEVLT